MIVLGKNVTRFFRIKIFMQEGSPKKSAFSIERHYKMGLEITRN